MTPIRQLESELLGATVRKLSEQGYQVIVEPSASLLPQALQKFRPDGIAIGLEPKLIIEIASENPQNAARINELQRILKDIPDWKLHLVLSLSSISPDVARVTEASITSVLDRILDVARIEPRAALLMGWAALEALSRERRPADFARPQSPGRIIEQFASEGIIPPSEAAFLRIMAMKRNAFIHGDLAQDVKTNELDHFVNILQSLIISPALKLGIDRLED